MLSEKKKTYSHLFEASTAWLRFVRGQEFEWMKPYGASLADVQALILAAGRGKHWRALSLKEFLQEASKRRVRYVYVSALDSAR